MPRKCNLPHHGGGHKYTYSHSGNSTDMQKRCRASDGSVNPEETNKLSARLCLLGWTAIGQIDKEDLSGGHHTRFIRKFWEQEHIGILSSKQQFSLDEQVAW